MTLRLDDKKAIVAEVASVAAKAHAAVAASYAGLTVAQLTDLRKVGRESGVYVRVVRNNLARRAFEGTKFGCMQDALVGPLILAFSQEDPGSAARLMRDFSKKFEKLEVRVVSFDGMLLPASDLHKLANLPTRDEAISQLMSVMLAPITKLVCTLVQPHTKLVRTIDAIRDQKQRAG